MEIWFSTKQRQDDKHTIDPGNQGSMLATVFGQWRKIRHSADSLTSLQAFSKKNAKTRSKWYKSTKIRNWVGSSTGQEMKSSFLETQQLQS
jgi:hypothetical protein